MKDIEDEIPFTLPEGWAWCRLGEIGVWRAGSTPNRKNIAFYKNGTIPWLLTGDLNDGIITDIPNKITEEAYCQTSLKLNPTNSICIAMYGATIGKLGILSTPATTNQACCVCSDFKGISNKYLFYFLLQHREKFILLGFGGAQPNISKEKIIATLIPLPPLIEQQRIVAKIETIFVQIDLLEQNKADLQTAVKQTKSKILDLAIRGKLVPQDTADEPASVMLEKLRAEKETKIAAGEIKRGKNDSYIYKNSTDNCYYQKYADGCEENISDEIPFDVPDGWVWCRLGEIADIARGGSPRPIEYFITDKENGINWIKIGDTVPESKYIISAKEKIKPEGKKYSRFVHAGDFLLTNSMSFGRPYILKIDGCIHDGWLVFADIINSLLKEFLYYTLSSQYIYNSFSLVAAGSTVKNLKADTVKQVLFPFPPLAEQKRIVVKIEELFAQLDFITVVPTE